MQETGNVRLIYYSPTHAYLIPHLIRSFENAYRFHENLWDYHSREKVSILFQDFRDSVHGGAITIPRNMLDIGISPPNFVFETVLANDRMSWLMNHELTHIVTSDRTARSDRVFRRLFSGKVMPEAENPVSMAFGYLTTPRFYSPRWYHEGIAVFMETWMSGGLGRALGGYDEMVFRALVRDDSYIYQAAGLESEGTTIDFQVGANSYLYGARFVTYLANRHGVPKLLDWVRRSEGTHRYFGSQFQSVYGTSLKAEWSRWISSERDWQRENLRRVREYPVTPLRRLTDTVLGSMSRAYWDPQSEVMYAAVQYPGQVAHLAALEPASGRIRKLADLKGAALYYVCSLAFDASGRRLFYTTDNKQWRDLNVLDVDTGHRRLLIADARTGDLAFSKSDQALWGIRRTDGFSLLVKFAPPYREWTEMRRSEYGHDIFDIDVSPDGKYITAGETDVSGRQRLVRFRVEDLLKQDAAPEVLHDFEFSSPSNFVFSPDGRFLYGTSYYTGVSNVFRYDFEKKEMEVLSNAETGLFRPLPLADGRLLAFEYTATGFVPVEMPVQPVQDVSAVRYLGQEVVASQPVVKSYKLGSPANIDFEGLKTYSGRYRPLRSMSLISAYPLVQGYKDTAAFGWRFTLSDNLMFSRLDGTASLSPSPGRDSHERLHGSFRYRYWTWALSGWYNNADFYDLFGPTKNSRKGYSLRIENTKNLIFDTPRTLDLQWEVAGYGGLDTLPDYQNVAAPVSRFLTGKASLTYSFLDRSLGAVDDEKGVKWQMSLRNNYVDRKLLPRVYANYDYGFLLPIKHSSVWLRSAAGYSWGNWNEPFAKFYFGGFGNNWVDRLDSNRYREYYSFPGVELNQIGSKDFARTQIEWNFPALKFKRLGTSSFYCNWARVSLFSSGLLTNIGRPDDRTLSGDVGAQLDLRVVPFSYLNSTFSVGYAVAADTRGRRSGELMISLKLL